MLQGSHESKLPETKFHWKCYQLLDCMESIEENVKIKNLKRVAGKFPAFLLYRRNLSKSLSKNPKYT